MSSTSSSDCESCDCTYWQERNQNDCGQLIRGALNTSRHVPMYATMAHPLIYYAEVPLNRRQANDQPKKENPFKKAFKWYTQERNRSNKNTTGPERCGFADWLDSKYIEYLVESGHQPELTTSNEPRNFDCHPCPPCPGKAKKFARMSTWKKRRRPANESGDVPEKSTNKSCEFLLKPKELSRAASENFTTPTSGGKSNATVTSLNAKYSMRSHSLSDLGREKSVPKHGEAVPYILYEIPKAQKQEPTPPHICSMCHQKQADRVVPSKNQNLTNQPSAICAVGKIPKVKKAQSKQQDSTNHPKPCCNYNQKKVLEADQVLSEEGDSTNQPEPCCKCNKERVPKVEQVPYEEENSTNQPISSCECPYENLPKVEQIPEAGESRNQPEPCCKCNQEKVPKAEQVPSEEENSTNQPISSCKEKLPKIEQMSPEKQIPKNEHKLCCKWAQKKVSEIDQQPLKEQNPTNQPRSPCNKTHQEKVPEAVQVPSQSRTVEDSCQCSREKVVPVNEETQYYEPASSEPSTTTQKTKACLCNICRTPILPPPCMPCQGPPCPMLCLPLKIQTSTISSPAICFPEYTITSAQNNAPKKQLKVEKPSCSCKASPCPNDCHEVCQILGQIPIQRQSYSTVAMNEENGELSLVKEVAVVSTFTRSVTCINNEAAQTSDHSIQFDKDGEYPLFLKIIYADVVKNECCN